MSHSEQIRYIQYKIKHDLISNPIIIFNQQSSLDDYETIPVEAYGMAMLRGMGWKASEGIGLSRKGYIFAII